MTPPTRRDAEREALEREALVKDAIARDWGWNRIDAPGSREFFARDEQGRTLWLIGREIPSRTIFWEWPEPSPRYDFIVGVLYSRLGEYITIFCSSHAAVERLKHVNNGICRLRWDDETMAAVEYLYDHS